MTRERIVFNPHSGGVAVCIPSENAIAWMARGGRWDHIGPDYWKVQIRRLIDDGHSPDAVERVARGLHFGGLTRREAIEVIAQRDCAHLGSAIEIVDVMDIPDRTYRDAWRRSSNGGPIVIDEDKARAIDERRMWAAYEGKT